MVQEEVRSRLMIDFNSNPGKNCICCCWRSVNKY
jgi:hypothetical protein